MKTPALGNNDCCIRRISAPIIRLNIKVIFTTRWLCLFLSIKYDMNKRSFEQG